MGKISTELSPSFQSSIIENYDHNADHVYTKASEKISTELSLSVQSSTVKSLNDNAAPWNIWTSHSGESSAVKNLDYHNGAPSSSRLIQEHVQELQEEKMRNDGLSPRSTNNNRNITDEEKE